MGTPSRLAPGKRDSMSVARRSVGDPAHAWPFNRLVGAEVGGDFAELFVYGIRGLRRYRSQEHSDPGDSPTPLVLEARENY